MDGVKTPPVSRTGRQAAAPKRGVQHGDRRRKPARRAREDPTTTRVLLAGLDEELARRVAARLGDVALVQAAQTEDDAIRLVQAGDWSALVVDHEKSRFLAA